MYYVLNFSQTKLIFLSPLLGCERMSDLNTLINI